MFKATLIAQLALSIFVSGLFTSCNTKSRQQKLAIQATARLREQFNSGACSSISASAESSDETVKGEWQRGCEQLRENLGNWGILGNVQARTLDRSGDVSTVMVEGLALFDNGDHQETYWLESDWHVSSGLAKVYFLHLTGGDKQFSLPHALPPIRRKIDAPTHSVSSVPPVVARFRAGLRGALYPQAKAGEAFSVPLCLCSEKNFLSISALSAFSAVNHTFP